jgi:Xaa-Pro dipeptidase
MPPAASFRVSLFERAEYLRRIAAAQRLMADRGIELLLVAVPENINYLSGYAGWSFYTPQLLVLHRDTVEPLLIVRLMDVNCAEHSTFLAAENVIGYPEEYIGAHGRHPMQYIAQCIRERGWQPLRTGIEKGAAFFTVRSYEILRESLPGADFIDADLLVTLVRLVKSDAELAVMRQAGVLAGCAMHAAIDAIAPGVRQCDAAAALYRAQLRGTSQFGGSVPNSVLMPAGARTRAPHLKWTDEPYRVGESVNIELSGSRHQYHVALSRTVSVGTPAPGLAKLSAVVRDGLNTALEAVRPGVRCEDVAAAWTRVIERAGYRKRSRIGYSMGLCFQPTWVERTASLQHGDRTLLAPGMTFHMMCGMWEDDHNLVMSESFAVTPGGHELLTQFPQELFVKN